MKIGITGHQDLSNFDINWIEQSVKVFLSNEKATMGYSSLAIGADQLFVQILIELKVNYGVVIPCRQYSSTFKSDCDLNAYLSLLEDASTVMIMDYEQPSEDAFYQAGIKIMNLSDVLVAVWDGKPAKGLGGTGDVVKLAKDSLKKVFHINPVNQTTHLL